MKLFVHALDGEDRARLREVLHGALGSGAPRAELWASHKRDDGGRHAVALTVHAPRLRALHVEASGHELEAAARDAVLELGDELAREAIGQRHAVRIRPDPIDRGPWPTFKPRHGPV